MDTQTIWAVAGSIIASVGGAGVIICAVSSYLSNLVAKRLEKRYEQHLSKELEQYKSILEQKRYVTKAQFDKEFELYHLLSKKFFDMIVPLSSFTEKLIEGKHLGEIHDQNSIGEIFHQFMKITIVTSEAQNNLYENAAFIPKHIFEMYKAVYEDANSLFWQYANRLKSVKSNQLDISDVVTNDDKVTIKRIESDFYEINSVLREYLTTLTVVN